MTSDAEPGCPPRLGSFFGIGLASDLLWCMESFTNTQPEMGSAPEPNGRAVFRRRHRISGGEEFAAVFDAKLRKSRGVITVFLLATPRLEHRLGLSVGKRVGNAVVRGRFKRMMREAFRLARAGMPSPSEGGSYDIVVTARGHRSLSLDEYSEMMRGAIEAAHRTHEKRAAQ